MIRLKDDTDDTLFRELGTGPGVVCVHANASSSGQWRALMESLAPKFHVLAADSYGAGKSPPRPKDRPPGRATKSSCSIEGLGHMAPVTHPERVNPLIVQFLEKLG